MYDSLTSVAYRWVILIFGMLALPQLLRPVNYTGIAKFVSADLGLDKSMLGAMGSVFFYAYALAQMPWGVSFGPVGQPKSSRACDLFHFRNSFWVRHKRQFTTSFYSGES